MKNKFIALFSLSVVLFSCNPVTNNLSNDFKTAGSVNNTTNGQSPYKFDGMINRTDGLPVPVPTPVPTPPSAGNVDIYNATLFAGSPNANFGNQNGQGANALFSLPYNMAFDSLNNLYVIDFNFFVRKIDTNGNVTNIFMTSLDGNTTNTQIAANAFTFDSADNMYIAGSNGIIKITPTGIGTTKFSCNHCITLSPIGLALDKIYVDQAQNVYFTQSSEQLIKKIDLNGNLSVVAGQYNNSIGNHGASTDGNGTNATFTNPWGIISDNTGNFYVSDTFGSKIRKIDANNNVTTFSGSGIYGLIDSNAISSRYSYLYGMAFDQNNNIIVSDSGVVRKVDTSGNVSTLIVNNNDPTIKSRNTFFYGVQGVAVDHNNNIFIADTYHNRILKLNKQNISIPLPNDNKNYSITTIAGDGNNAQTNGQGINSSFSSPFALSFYQPTSTLFVTDYLSFGKVRKIDASNNVNDFYTSTEFINDLALNPNASMTIATGGGSSIQELDTNGIKITNNLNSGERKYSGIAKDSLGNLYSSDITYNIIRKNGNLFAGTLGQYDEYGFQDGAVGTAKFNSPQGLAVDSIGNVYVADRYNNCIRKIDSSGNTTTLAGSNMEGFKDGNGTNARFRQPYAIAVDSLGYVYVADSGNNRIRKIAPNGDVWTIAGSGSFSYADGSNLNSSFNFPSGITVDNLTGNVYVSDLNNRRIRKLTPQ